MAFYWQIEHEDRGTVAAGTMPFATEELARAASVRERRERGLTMGYGYYDRIIESEDVPEPSIPDLSDAPLGSGMTIDDPADDFED